MKRKLEATKVTVTNGDDAWVYTNKGSIEIYIWKAGQGTLSARITEAKLKKIIN